MLSQRIVHSDETLDEHFLKMKLLSLNCHIEDMTLIYYIIKAITCSIMKKSMLYGCTFLHEFRSKWKIYEQILTDDDKLKSSKPK